MSQTAHLASLARMLSRFVYSHFLGLLCNRPRGDLISPFLYSTALAYPVSHKENWIQVSLGLRDQLIGSVFYRLFNDAIDLEVSSLQPSLLVISCREPSAKAVEGEMSGWLRSWL